MQNILICIFAAGVILSPACSETKRLHRGNIIYTYADNQPARARAAMSGNAGPNDSIIAMKLTAPVRAKIEDKTDYYLVKLKRENISYSIVDSKELTTPDADKLKLYGNKLYFSEKDYFYNPKGLTFSECRFGLQTLSIPIKIRPGLRNDTLYPGQVETGVNIGFAPVLKYIYNIYNPSKKFMGKSLTQLSISTGPLLGLGATDLKKTGNAPGLLSDRKSALFSYGTFLMFGVNSINFGYAIGGDLILGEGHHYWVYQGKVWHGVIVALDIIK